MSPVLLKILLVRTKKNTKAYKSVVSEDRLGFSNGTDWAEMGNKLFFTGLFHEFETQRPVIFHDVRKPFQYILCL